jgi:hypothetical protein
VEQASVQAMLQLHKAVSGYQACACVVSNSAASASRAPGQAQQRAAA